MLEPLVCVFVNVVGCSWRFKHYTLDNHSSRQGTHDKQS